MLERLQPNQPLRFSGYRIEDRGIHFYLPGHSPGKLDQNWSVEAVVGKGKLQNLAMQYDGVQWHTTDALILQEPQPVYYRFKKNGEPDPKLRFKTDLAETVNLNTGEYNLIQPGAKNPTSNGANLIIFPDSFVSEKALAEKLKSPEQSKRNHFNVFGGGFNSTTIPQLRQILDKFGFTISESRPIIGGNPIEEWDRTGSHGYWTSNLYQRSPRIKTEQDFKNLVLSHAQAGTKLAFDAAFTSEGLNSIHYLSNLRYPIDSPFSNWFTYDQLHRFPFEPLKIGILPVKKGNITGDDIANHEAWDIRFIPPKQNQNSANSTWYIELYDPRIENEQGELKTNAGNIGPLTQYKNSLQKYRFPISGKEAQKKLKDIANAAHNPYLQKQLKRYWSYFQFDPAIADNSGNKWDGQKDMAKLRFKEHIVVRNNVKEAMKYWTEKVDRVIIQDLAEKLEAAKKQSPEASWREIANAFSKQSHPLSKSYNSFTGKEITTGQIEFLIDNFNRDSKKNNNSPAKLITQAISKHYPLQAIPCSPSLQINFATEALHKILNQGVKSPILRVIERLGTDVRSVVKRVFPEYQTNGLLTSKSFYKVLEEKLSEHTEQLQQHVANKLYLPEVTKLYHEEVASSIFYSILSGKSIRPEDVSKISPKQLNEWMESNIPEFVTSATPKKSAQKIAIWMIAELKKLDLEKLGIRQYLTEKARRISPESIIIARYLAHENGMGLNWRIDALKDLGDKDKAMSLDESVRLSFWKGEAEKINKFFDECTAEIRSVYPKSIIRPELTRTDLLIGKPSRSQNIFQKPLPAIEKEMVTQMIGKNRFDGVTNFQYFNKHYGLIRAIGRPDEGLDDLQVSPSEYIQKHLKSMMGSLALEKVFQYQNIASNHDFATSLYWLTLHPVLARQDHFWWMPMGSNDGYAQKALNELQFKKLGHTQLNDEQFNALQNKLNSVIADKNNFSEMVSPFIEKGDNRPEHLRIPTPISVKKQFNKELWSKISLQDLPGLSQKQFEQLKKDYEYLLTEPSELKAVRATLTERAKLLLDKPEKITRHLPNLSNTQAKELITPIVKALPRAFMDTVNAYEEDNRRWLGYQQFDFVINEVFKKMPSNALPKDREQLEKVKEALYTAMIEPALAQYKRMAALMNAIPGDPTHYMPDLFGQAGGEDYNNTFLGNRELVRTDWAKNNPVIQQYQSDLARIIKQRKEFEVLNNGQLFYPLDPEISESAKNNLDSSGVLPLIRDDGKGNQVIYLLNTGKPNNGWQAYNENANKDYYPDIQATQNEIEDYKLDLKEMGIAPKTRYSSVNPKTNKTEFLIVNDNGELVLEDKPEKGIWIETDRILVRETPVKLPSGQFISRNKNNYQED